MLIMKIDSMSKIIRSIYQETWSDMILAT